jgi:hypothetical protein
VKGLTYQQNYFYEKALLKILIYGRGNRELGRKIKN